MTDPLSRFSVIVPSIGRLSLVVTLKSCDSIFVDEVIVSPDGRQAYEACACLIEEADIRSPVCLLDPIEESLMGQHGHPQRNRAMLAASAPWLCFMDDDDRFVEGAFTRILLGLDAYKPHIFKARFVGGNEAGRTLWEDPELRECNVGTPMFVVPNRALGWWPSRRMGDYAFMAETCLLQGDPVFVDEVIAEVKP